jgi:hypothetical protein
MLSLGVPEQGTGSGVYERTVNFILKGLGKESQPFA